LLCHYATGNHREIAAWHEEIHRPEMHEQVPSFFFSQDWVAAEGYVKLPAKQCARGAGWRIRLAVSERYGRQRSAECSSAGLQSYLPTDRVAPVRQLE
jgi:hypothetical protein